MSHSKLRGGSIETALVAVEDPLTVTHRKIIADFAAKDRLPAVYGLREFVGAGGLMSYGANLADLFQRAAGYVDKILKGAKPADLPRRAAHEM
jgi:putative ABC transport system substrate-binding protein